MDIAKLRIFATVARLGNFTRAAELLYLTQPTVSQQIAALEKEKAENDQRLLAGIQSVAPALAALNLVAGTYGRNVAIATGEWAAAIDRKLAELRQAKKKC